VPIGAPGVSDPGILEQRGSRGLFVVGRLSSGSTIEQVRTQLQAVGRGLHEARPDAWTDIRGEPRRVTVIPAAQATVPPQLRGPVTGFVALLMAIVAAVLLIGCVNVANLLIARATGREREIALRLTLGANRARIIRQLLTESMVLAVFGALLGISLAWAGTRALALAVVDLPLPFDIRLDIAPDLRVLTFAGIITALAGVFFGLTPALMATRRSLAATTHREGGAVSKLRLRAALAGAQIAIAMVLLVAGGLLVRSLQAAQTIQPGFRPDGLLSVNLALNERGRSPEQRVQFQRELLERVRAVPGVSSASYAISLPLSGGSGRRSFGIEGYRPGEAEDMEINWSDVGPGYFRMMGTRLLRGREFEPIDGLSAPRTAIVNEAFARISFARRSRRGGSRAACTADPADRFGTGRGCRNYQRRSGQSSPRLRDSAPEGRRASAHAVRGAGTAHRGRRHLRRDGFLGEPAYARVRCATRAGRVP